MANKKLDSGKDNDIREPIVVEEVKQAVEKSEHFANSAEQDPITSPSQEEISMEQIDSAAAAQPQKRSGSTAIGLLALLVALGIGGAGYYFGTQELSKISQKIQQISHTAGTPAAVEMPNFDAEKAQLASLTENYQKAFERTAQLERTQAGYEEQIVGLQRQIQRLDNAPKADNSLWLLSDADFLLNNALRKLVLDSDINTTQKLLIEADSVLAQVNAPKVIAVRDAIKADLAQLSSVADVDQNALMLRLTQLANSVDDMPMISNEVDGEKADNGEVSDSLDDWQKNMEKSASSFLDHFIRISDRHAAKEKEFIAPNQEVYLRENIRLRLQIAILAIPRQQDQLYKQSLDAVGTWVRSYFDEQNDSVKSFLKELDGLSGQTIYIDAPKQLQSLVLLDQLLNKAPQKVEKMPMEAEKSLEQAAPEQPKADATQPAQAQ